MWIDDISIVWQCQSAKNQARDRIEDGIAKRKMLMEDKAIKKSRYNQLTFLNKIAKIVKKHMSLGAENIQAAVYFCKDESVYRQLILEQYFSYLKQGKRYDNTDEKEYDCVKLHESDTDKIVLRRRKINVKKLEEFKFYPTEDDIELAQMYIWFRVVKHFKKGTGRCRHFASSVFGALVEEASKMKSNKLWKGYFFYFGYLKNDHQIVFITTKDLKKDSSYKVAKLPSHTILIDTWLCIQPPVLIRDSVWSKLEVKIVRKFTLHQMDMVFKALQKGPAQAFYIQDDWEQRLNNPDYTKGSDGGWQQRKDTGQQEGVDRIEGYKKDHEGVKEYTFSNENIELMLNDTAMPEYFRGRLSLAKEELLVRKTKQQHISYINNYYPREGHVWDDYDTNLYWDVDDEKQIQEERREAAENIWNGWINTHTNRIFSYAEESVLKGKNPPPAWPSCYLGTGKAYYIKLKKNKRKFWKEQWEEYRKSLEWGDKVEIRYFRKRTKKGNEYKYSKEII